jgi:hypothetical protein
LKFKWSKGEVLEVEMPGLALHEIVSHGIFVLPVGGRPLQSRRNLPVE